MHSIKPPLSEWVEFNPSAYPMTTWLEGVFFFIKKMYVCMYVCVLVKMNFIKKQDNHEHTGSLLLQA